VLAWIFFDGNSVRTIEHIERDLGIRRPSIAFDMRDYARRDMSVTVAEVGAAIAAGTLIVMLTSLFVGSQRFRTTRMWLVFTAIGCGWLGLVVAWPEIYWRGQQLRIKADISAAEIVVRNLLTNWPRHDGQLPDIGAFLAYPKSVTAALMPLGAPTFPGTSLRFSLVERSVDDAIRFELAGSELGAWLEWRPDGSVPTAFVGGLATNYYVMRYKWLAPHWFLVRYHRGLRDPQSVPTKSASERTRGRTAAGAPLRRAGSNPGESALPSRRARC
jgi:hypothetical protein